MTEPSLDARQAAFNLRYRRIRDALLAEGWTLNADLFVLARGPVRIYPAMGSPSIQRILKLEHAYARYIIKTTGAEGAVVEDDLLEPVDTIISQIREIVASKLH